jgi:hypothetical protein
MQVWIMRILGVLNILFGVLGAYYSAWMIRMR